MWDWTGSQWRDFRSGTEQTWGVNSIPELELMINSEIGIAYLKRMESKLINLELGLKFATKQLNPQSNLPFNFLIQKYFFQNNPTWNINYSG